MSDYDFRDNLVTLASFNTPTEAELARARLASEGIESSVDGGATGTWLNHVGPDLIGASLSVRQGDLRQAREVLADVLETAGDATSRSGTGEDDEYYDDEDWSDEDDDYDQYSEEPIGTSPLSRAFRAAVIGTFLLPPLLNIYSMKVILDNRLWQPQPRHRGTNWRFYVALSANVASLFIVWFIFVPWYQQLANWF